jgi:two-component system, NarL family, nitrate/nitrite response regulator NarL
VNEPELQASPSESTAIEGEGVVVCAATILYAQSLAEALRARLKTSVAAASPVETLELVRSTGPALLLLDVSTALARALLPTVSLLAPHTSTIAFGLSDNTADLLSWAGVGAAGFMADDATLADLWTAIASVTRKEVYCSPRLIARLIAGLAARSPHADNSPLTRRELEILALIDVGATNKDIASRLHIELATVKNHVHNILQKLQVRRRGEAAARVRDPNRLIG